MKRLAEQARLASLLGLLVFLWTTAYAQITPLGDTYINTATPTTNYGAKTLLDVDGAKQITYIQFNLASIPATTSVSQATLKLYVNSVTTAGSFNVDFVNSAWSEGTIDASNAPPPGAAIASNVNVTAADTNQYMLIDVTSAVQAWLNGSEPNNGLALVANSTFDASFDSKENTTTSHPPELDIVFAAGGSGGGTITGVTAGTALTGGGTSGTVTLNVDTTKVPLLAAANTFTGNQTVNGNLTTYGSTYAEGGLSGAAANGTVAIYGFDTSSAGWGGLLATSSNGLGIYGVSASCCSYGVLGNGNVGVAGTGNSFGVEGMAPVLGVWGESTTSNGTGVQGSGGLSSGGYGVFGIAYDGVYGEGTNIGVVGTSPSSSSPGVAAYNTSTGDALFADNQTKGAYAAFFLGNVDVDGTLSKAGGSFKIDDPLDPANKYLYHSFVESPDMMNIYNGNVTTDGQGNAVVELPDWFEALNRDYRYQLTVIGQFAQAIVASKVANHQFGIRTDKPNVEVSWQVTGIRQDVWANAHRIPVEVEKAADERGFYMHPELFGAPAEKGIAAHRHPGMLNPPKRPSPAPETHASNRVGKAMDGKGTAANH